MANSDKDIRVVPNRNKSGLPNIAFTGYNNDPIVLNVLDDNTISFEGSSGQLFSVSNAVTTGTIFSVNDISGIPSFRVDADGTVGIAEFSGNVGIGLQSPQSKLSVGGDINVGAGYTFRVAGTKVLDSSSLGTGVTGSSLTSVGTISSGTWQGTAIGVNYGGTGATNASDARSFLGAATAGTNSDLTRLLGVQHLFVTIPTAAAIGITVKAATSQAASMMEFVNSSNSLLAWITKDGTFAHGAYFTHNDGRVPGISVQRANAAGIVARGFNSDAFPAIEVQNNGGGLGVGLYPGGLVYGGVLQAWASTASTNTTTGALIVAGGAAIAGTTNFGRDVRIFSSLASSSPFTGSLVISGGVGISNNLFVGGGVAFTSSIASTSTTTGTLVVTGGVGIGGSVFTSTSNASSISGVVLSNGSVTLTGTYTQSNSSTTAFQVRDGSNNPAFVIDTIGDIISLPVAVASTSTGTGSLVVAGGVGIGGTANIRSAYVYNDLLHIPGTGNTFGMSFTSFTLPTGFTGSGLCAIYAENRFVATGGSVVVYSDDLINWTTSYIPWNTSVYNQSITYGNGVYVVTSSVNSYVAYSRDLSTWTLASVQYQNYQTAAYGNGRFVINAGGVVGISTNGANWSSLAPIGSAPNYQALKFQNGYFYSSGSRSIDGIFWEPLNISISVGNISYGNGLYFGAQYNSSNYAYSYDGVNFTATTIENNVYVGTEYFNGVHYLRTQHNNAYLYYSVDGFNYAKVGMGGVGIFAMAFGKNKILAFGRDGAGTAYGYYAEGTNGKIDLNPIREGNIDNTVIGSRTPKPANFTDLSTTGYVNIVNQAGSASSTTGALVVRGGVGIGQTLNVAGSVNVSNSLNLVNTTTGIATTWTRTVVGTGATISYLAYANNLYVGVGYSSITSTDGVNWTTRTLPHNLSSVAFGNGIWSGLLGNSALGATSTNGTTWISFAMTNSRNWTVIAFGNGKFVTLGLNSSVAAYSTNGFNWTEVTLPVSGIWVWLTYGGGYFVAVANSSTTAVYSSDGINWNTTTLPSAAGWNRISYGNGYYFVVGSGNFGAYSKDLINWTSYSLTVNGGNTLYSEYNNGTFVVVDVLSGTNSNIITGDFSSRTAVAIPFTQSLAALVAGDRVFIAGYGQTFYTFPIPNNSITLSPNTTGEINNVEIGNTKPASGSFSNIFSQGLVAIGATARSISPFTGALVVAGGVGIGGSLFVGNTLSVASSTASTSTTTGALIVSGGVGISGNINSLGRFNFGTLSAPTMSTVSGFGTGGLTPSTTYYYKLSAIDYNNNESLPSIEYSTTLSASQYGVRFYIFPSPGAVGYKLYRTTTSGSYTNSFVQIYRVNQWINGIFYYDVGKSTSTGTPLSVTSGNTSTLGTSAESVSNVLPSLTIPTGTLQVKSPNFVGVSNNGGYAPAIETGTTDFVALRETFGFNGLSASTGGTLTPGQTYYYVATIVDHYGNESLPTPELAYTADAGGAVIISFNVTSVQVPAYRIYRTTTPGNYTNSYLGELPDRKDIGYPTMSGSPPTTTSFAGIRLNPRADFDAMSYIPNIDLAPSHRNGILRKLDVPYTGAIAVTTSGIAGSLLPNTTYYYKCSAFDIFGGSAYPTAEVSVSTGTSTAVTISGGGGILYAKVYRSTTKNNYINVPTYYVSSFPFTDRGDTTFTDTPSNVSNYIQSQLFRNQNNAVPQNYLRDLSIGPILNNFPFSILAPVTGLGSVTASTGGTLVEGQVYYYVMEAVDIYNYGSSSGQPIRFVATAGGAANVTQYVVGAYGYVAWNLYRTSNLASWTNSLIAAGIKGTSFIDIGYPGRSGSPNFSYHRARNVVFDNRGVFHIPTIANQLYGQNITAPSAPYRTGGSSAGSLTTNTTYYYRVMPYGGANQQYGYASDEFQYTTGANEKSISMTIGGHKIGAMYYRVYRSTTFNNFTNAYYFETPHTSFIDYGHTALQTTGDVFINNAPYANTVNLLNQGSGNYLAYTTITGQTGGLKIHLKSPVISSISSGTGGTLSTNTDYWYKVDAIDAHGVRTFVSDEAYVNTGSNNSVTLTWDDVPGAYYYRVFRATASQTFANKLIASYVNARTFTDLNFPTTTGTPVTIFENGQQGATAALFQMDNSKVFGVMPRTVISNIDSTQSTWYTDFSLRITSPPVGSASGALLQVGAGFTNFSSAGFNGTTYGTQVAIGAAIGFTGSLLDAQTAGVSRFRINFDGSSNIGSTTGSGSTSTGALIISGGVGIGQSLFTSTSYSSSISGAIFSNGSATLSGSFTQNNSSTTAFQVRDGSNNPAFVIDTIADIISLPVAVASTSTGTGSLVVAGGVGIGGSINIGGRVGIGTNLLTGQINIQNQTASTPSIVIQGATSQSADYLRVMSSTGTTTLKIDSDSKIIWPNTGTNPAKIYGTTYSTQGRIYVEGNLYVNPGPIIVNTGGGEASMTSTAISFAGGVGLGYYSTNIISTDNAFRVQPTSTSVIPIVINAQNASWTSGNLFLIQNNGSSVYSVDYAGNTNIYSTVGSASTTSGALKVTGGVGIGGSLFVGNDSSIGGTLNISGNASIGGTLNVSGSNSYFQNNLYVGNNTQGRLYFSQATLGSAGTTVIPTMAFIGATNSPITLSVLPDNSLSFDGSSGQLFSINNNLSTGWIFSINDISGLPIFRTNADLTVAMGEYGGNVGIGLSNPTFKLQVSGNAGISGTTLISNATTSTNTTSGALVVSGGVGIGGSLFLSSSVPSSLSGVVVNNGVVSSGSWAGNAITVNYGGTGYNSYAKGDILVGAGSTFIKLNVGTDNFVLTALSTAATGLTWSPTAATGITTLNGINTGLQYLAIGYSGSVPAFSSSGSTHTLNIPIAGTGSTGLVSTQSQSFAGIKTFTNAVSITDNTGSGTYTAGALTVTGGVGIGGTLNVQGDFNVQGTFTTINSTTITVADKNIELGVVTSPSDLTAEGGGITLKGATDKLFNWYSGVGWSSSESINLASGNTFKINNTIVLSNSSLGTGVTNSSLTALGTITTGIWSATTISPTYGGTGLAPTFTVGDLLYANTSSTWGRLSASSNSGYILSSAGSGATPTYVNPLSITVGLASTSNYSYQSGYGITAGLATTATYAHQSGYAITSGNSSTSNFATSSGLATTATYANQSGYAITSGSSNTSGYADQSGYGLTSGTATTATYSYTSGYGITSGSANSWTTPRTLNLAGDLSGSVTWSGSGDTTITATIAANSVALGTDTTGQYASTLAISGSGITATSSNADDSTAYTIYSSATASNTASAIVLRDGSGNFSAGTITGSLTGTASTATYALQSGYGITAGSSATATTASNINVNNATAASAHFLHFSPSATGSGLATSSNTTLSYNPSTLILSTSGLAVTASTSSTTTSSGALIVTGGAGIGGSLFTSTSNASSISGVILNNGAITNTGTITSTGVMTLSNSSTTAFQVRDGSNNSTLTIDTIGDIVTLPVAVASTTTGTGSLVVAGGVGIGGSASVGGRLQMFNGANYTAFVSSASGNTVYTLPATSPATGTSVLQSTSAGVMTWVPMTAGGGSGTVTTLTAGTGISFSTGSTITTTGTIRARRPMVASFCAGYTPAASGADSVVIRLPDSPSDGTTAITYEPQEFHIRVETPSATTTTIQLEKYTGTGAFSGTAITSVSISGGAVYEAQTSIFAAAGTFLTSGDKLRINFTALSASHANFSVYLELEEV